MRSTASRRREGVDNLLKPGDEAPDFGFGDEARFIALSTLAGRSLVLMVVCGDGVSSLCREAVRAVRAGWSELRDRDVVTVAIVRAPEADLIELSRSECLPCVFVSDTEGRVISRYGAEKREAPVFYLVDHDGVIRARWAGWPSMKRVLMAVDELTAGSDAAA